MSAAPASSSSSPRTQRSPSHALTGTALTRISAQKWDTIVVGSGVGGLATAAILARAAGERVLVLERHTKLGGCTHEFEEHGLTFDTGLHYIGGSVWKPNSFAGQAFDYISDSKLVFAKMDDPHDVAVIDEEQPFPWHCGLQNQMESLKSKFPDFAHELDAYWEDVLRTANEYQAFVTRDVTRAYVPERLSKCFVKNLESFGEETIDEALDRLGFKDQLELRSLLTYLHGDYGTHAGEGSWVQHAAVVAHYAEGAAYPIGGPSAIARACLDVIQRPGGQCFTMAKVESLLVEEGRRVRGVVCRGLHGAMVAIPSKRVVSAIGAHHTFTHLLPDALVQNIPRVLRAKEALLRGDLPLSPSHAMTFVALRGSKCELGLTGANWWVNDTAIERSGVEVREGFESVFISFPSAKDPTWESRYPSLSVCEIVVVQSPQPFEKWAQLPSRSRGKDYDAAKDRLARRMLEVLFRHFPQLEDRVVFYESSTPYSAQHNLGSVLGCSYGLKAVPQRYRAAKEGWLSVAPPIDGLYLAGQDIVSCGIMGALVSGMACAAACSVRAALALRPIFAPLYA